jgi:alkylhydroperoxidase/carboxymuconolactone decarboxylase family protein YurZ
MPSAEQVRELLGERGVYDFGFVPAMSRLILSHLGLAPSFGAHFMQVMFAPGALDRREREMIAGVASAAQDCFY